MVPCITPCGINDPGTGLYEVGKLIDSKRNMRPEYPCPVCNEWQNIDYLLRNAPAIRPVATAALFAEFADVKRALVIIHQKILEGQTAMISGLDQLDANDQRLLSRIDDAYDGLLRSLTDEAKEGPRLFSFEPVDRSNFNPKKWTSAKFRLTLWCEHSQLPLPAWNGPDSKKASTKSS